MNRTQTRRILACYKQRYGANSPTLQTLLPVPAYRLWRKKADVRIERNYDEVYLIPAASDEQKKSRRATTATVKYPDQPRITHRKTGGKRPRAKNNNSSRKPQEKKGKWSGKSLKTKYKRVYQIKNSENFQSVFKHNKKQVYVGVYHGPSRCCNRL